MKTKFLDVLAYNNANENTKQVLSTLPEGADTAQFLETAAKIVQQEKAAYLADAITAAIKPFLSVETDTSSESE